MPQWEYKKIDLGAVPRKIDDVDLLDDAGRDGWDLVGITVNNVAYLKRPLHDVAPATKPPAKQSARKTAS